MGRTAAVVLGWWDVARERDCSSRLFAFTDIMVVAGRARARRLWRCDVLNKPSREILLNRLVPQFSRGTP